MERARFGREPEVAVEESDRCVVLLRELGSGEFSPELADLLRDAVAPSLLPCWQQTADEITRQLSQLLRAPVMVALLKHVPGRLEFP